MDVYETKRFPSIMDNMGTEVHCFSLILLVNGRARGGGGLDKTAKGSEIGLSASKMGG